MPQLLAAVRRPRPRQLDAARRVRYCQHVLGLQQHRVCSTPATPENEVAVQSYLMPHTAKAVRSEAETANSCETQRITPYWKRRPADS